MTYGLGDAFISADLHGKYAQAEFGSEMISIIILRVSLKLVLLLCLLKGSFRRANLLPHMRRIRNHPYCSRRRMRYFSGIKPLNANKGDRITPSNIGTDSMDTGKNSQTPKQKIDQAHLILQDSIGAL